MTSAGSSDRLHRLLGGPDMAWLVDRARRRMALGRPLTGPVSLRDPRPEQRQAAQSLLGRPPRRGSSLTVLLQDVDAAVRRAGLHPDGLAGAVITLTGPVVDVIAERREAAAAWHAAMAALVDVAAERPELSTWCTAPHTTALIRRLSGAPHRATALVADLARVLTVLPATGIPLARLAVECTGDAHALDQGRPLATLVLAAVREVWWRSDQPAEPDQPHRSGSDWTPGRLRRALWDAAGVTVDELSSTVLVLNLLAAADDPLHRLTAATADCGEPLVLTLRQLARRPVRFTATHAYVCENPAVVAAAADTLGAACPPLVCVNGQPTAAAVRVLRALHAGGTTLAYHGDFDWGGLRIANLLRQAVRWRPWRFDTAAHRAAAGAGRCGQPLTGTPVAAAWDADLGPAMAAYGRRIEEESVLDDLLTDLAAHHQDGPVEITRAGVR